tara:strand:- start:4199 stop:4384 length:186 start_codon:yes stop_codon:yes gene_type:complete
MKIKLKNLNIKLPNCWKQCGTNLDNWNKLHSGKMIEIKTLPDNIKHLVDVSAKTKKTKGDK